MRKERTPRGMIRSSLRRLFLRSRERATAIKRDCYTCQKCGIKASKKRGLEQKVEVHHKDGIGNWEEVIDSVQKEILCSPEHLETLCKECHKKEKIN